MIDVPKIDKAHGRFQLGIQFSRVSYLINIKISKYRYVLCTCNEYFQISIRYGDLLILCMHSN